MSRGSFQDGRFNRPAVSLPVVVIPVPAKRPPRARPHQWEHNDPHIGQRMKTMSCHC
ncbi:hypothetical protein GCM10027562_27740 [Arthrobacter pigmenti]